MRIYSSGINGLVLFLLRSDLENPRIDKKPKPSVQNPFHLFPSAAISEIGAFSSCSNIPIVAVPHNPSLPGGRRGCDEAKQRGAWWCVPTTRASRAGGEAATRRSNEELGGGPNQPEPPGREARPNISSKSRRQGLEFWML